MARSADVVEATTPSEDTGYAPDRWAFDAEVTRVFEDMLRRSIPQYDVMRQACTTLGLAYFGPRSGALIVDLGCSRGEALEPFVRTLGSRGRYIGVEISDAMLSAARARFAPEIRNGLISIDKLDLRTAYPDAGGAVLTLCILTLQFTPLEYRNAILRRIYEHTAEGGALLLVEKVLGEDAGVNERLVDAYYELKAQNGYTQEEIDRKRLALEGVLVPLTAKWNEDALRSAGFRHVECFWRWMNFAGWVAVKRGEGER